MTDDTTPHSGSRWEPTPDETAPVAQSGVPPEAAAAAAAVPPAQRSWRDPSRGKGALVGAAAGLVLVSGLGGFALGHATAGRDEIGLVGTGFGGDGDGGQHGLPGTPPDVDRDGEGGFGGTPPGLHDDDSGTPPGGTTEDDDTGSDDQTGSGATT